VTRSSPGPSLRPCIAVTGSVVVFALTVERLGFLAAVASNVLVATLASGELRVSQAVLLAAVVAAVMALLFVGLLDQPLPLVTGR